MKQLWHHCHAVTLAGGRYGIVRDAALIIDAGRIAWIGTEAQLDRDVAFDEVRDLGGRWLTPGLIDCHTHLVFGGDRSNEFEQRLEGVSYSEIAKQGGGIVSSVRATREANFDELLASAEKRAKVLLREGVTTLEVKSGYGLDLESERKMLKVARALGERLPAEVLTTCLAAHALPPEYRERSDEYIDLVCEEILPTLAKEGLVDAVDGFCEGIAFSVEQMRRVFETAKQLGLPLKLHAEQLSRLGGCQLAAEFGALSADHVEYADKADARAMAQSSTAAVLLPGAFLTLRETQLPPVADFREQGVTMALASDLNPGTSPVLSLRLMMNLGCTLFRLTPEEALAGVTINAAKALGIDATHGSLEVGKWADAVVWEITGPAELSYWLGGQLPVTVFKAGKELEA
ncbi:MULTISPECIES: imidazolonepropionase [unclassified Halomonas]|uniref:imidazolonepropionase n=1 Tax=unclassified Halomonas TaxID=2609666 RepID=UPI0005549F20|nr:MULTISPECIES: imidazolonepropionase [unclassified Halomonas]CEP36772.1 Imidazolonepropionase [Halomonas sp. R57-5]